MIAVLAEHDIPASRVAGDANTYRIRVDSADMARAVRILQATGYPKDSFRSIGEVFPGDGIIVTPYEQRARMSFALSQELSRTISDIDGVVSARVHVMLPESDNIGRPQPPSASVVVHQFGQGDLNELSQRVRLIVSNAVANLPPRNVAVSIFPARNLSDTGRVPATTGTTHLSSTAPAFSMLLLALAGAAFVAGCLVFLQRRKQPT